MPDESAGDEDRSAWPRNRTLIRRGDLLRLIEQHNGPAGLDLRGAVFVGDKPEDYASERDIDLSPEALTEPAEEYRKVNGGENPPWLSHCDSINLAQAILKGATFRRAQLRRAYLGGAELRGAFLQNAQLRGAYLKGAQLQNADLAGADLNTAWLQGAELQGASLYRAQLPGAWLQGAELQGVDLYEVSSLARAHWYNAVLDNTRIQRDSLGRRIGDELSAHREPRRYSYRVAKEAYLSLKNNFIQTGRYDDASWAYVKEQQMEKMAFYWEWRHQGWPRLRHHWWRPKRWRLLLSWRYLKKGGLGVSWLSRPKAFGPLRRWLRNWSYELLTGYGERPANPIIVGGLMILGFGLGFRFTQAITSLKDAMIYSMATFATFNLARLDPRGTGIEVASAVEALLGIGILALFVFTLGNRMSRG